jgi:hypothetical protein
LNTISSAYIIVLSYDSKESFQHVNSYIDYIIALDRKGNGNIFKHFNIFLVINKADLLSEQRLFNEDDIYSKLKDYNGINITLKEVSAKNGLNIGSFFENLLYYLSGSSIQNINNERGFSFKLLSEDKVKKKKCC